MYFFQANDPRQVFLLQRRAGEPCLAAAAPMPRAQAEIPVQNRGLFSVPPLALFLLALGNQVPGMFGGFQDTSGR